MNQIKGQISFVPMKKQAFICFVLVFNKFNSTYNSTQIYKAIIENQPSLNPFLILQLSFSQVLICRIERF